MKDKESEALNATSVENGNNSKIETENMECDESSSSDSLIEIRLNEHIRKSELTDFDIRALVVRCSSCGHQINHFSSKEVKKHRKLGVLTCKDCYEFYGSSEFSQDESGYNYCTWCGNGGKLIVCDYCPNGFCNACIRRNFGRSEISVTTKEGWKCYCCDKKRLKQKINFCNFIAEYKEHSKEKKAVVQSNQNITSEKWLQTVFSESDEACKKFHRKMSKLKSIGMSKSKSLKHVITKMEELINNHKVDLKNIATSLSKRYASHIEFQLKAEQESKTLNISVDANNDMVDQKNSEQESKSLSISDDANNDVVNPIESELSSENKDIECIVLDEDHVTKENDTILSDSSPSILPSKDAIRSSKIRSQAKLLLLKSSSESDNDNKVQISDTDVSPTHNRVQTSDMDVSLIDNKVQISDKDVSLTDNVNQSKCNEQIEDKNKGNVSHVSESDISGEEDAVKNKSSISESNAKRKLTFSFSDSSDSDFNIQKSDFQEIEKVLDQKFENEDLNKDENVELKNIELENDPKLKLQTKVELIRCNHLFKDGETYVKISDKQVNNIDVDEEAKLDKLVDNLCRLPRNTKHKTNNKTKYVPKTIAATKKELLESSSSISLSSEEDEDQKKIAKKNPVQESNIPKKYSSDSDNNSSNLSLGSDSESKKKTKHSKANKKADDDSSSDDFIPVRRRKYDKLLHAPLLSDDENKPKEKRNKKAPRKRKALSSEEEKKKSSKSSGSTTSSEEEEEKTKQRRKRRRIKHCGSTSEEDEDDAKDESQENTPGKGRKNIRKIVSQKKLAVTTKEAQLEEKERRKRIQERQRLYNKIEDMSFDGKEVVTRKMVLEVDQDSKEEIVEINPDLVCKLKPHQVNGVKFMWECTIETVKDLNKPGSGCILAHCMGLGKTLQVIAFLHTCLSNPIVSKTIKRAMIICPYNTALNWASEFSYWLDDVENNIIVHQLTSIKTNIERLDVLKYWFTEGGVVILSYDLFRRLASGAIKIKSALRKQLVKYLLDPGPDIAVCDEGHILRNEKSAISVATSKLATRRRIVLTGTPLQNNLKEYHCMLSFVKPNLLGTMKEFKNRFVNPIINGQYDDSNEYDVKLMKKRIHILHKLLEGCVQRCDYSALTKFLPTKHEFVISVKLSEVQMKMYECYLEKITTAKKDLKAVGSTLFIDFNNLRCIWTHPYICHISHERSEYRKMFKDEEEEEEAFINDESEESKSTPSSSDTSDDDKLIKKIEMEKEENEERKKYRTRSAVTDGDVEDEEDMVVSEKSKQWYHEFISEEDKYKFELSGKMVLLVEILKECEAIGDKIILFSQSLLTLDMLEDVLEHLSMQKGDETDAIQDARGTWLKGLDYFRMDGATSADFRKSYIDMFNDPSNDRARLFLISTRAGSLGTNLVGANRVIIFDTSWNPSHDVQAIFRVYRFGQLKPVYIYRLLAQGTMEEKIYDRQVTKLSLSCRVVDEQQIDRHFSAADLAELYTFDRNSTTNRPTPMVPKDRLLAELLIRNKDWIVTYHEHDSLLQNQTEEDLTEEERQAAWTEYENEKEGKIAETDNNPGLTNLDFTKDLDFSQIRDYEGKLIPDVTTIITTLFERIRAERPDIVNTIEFKRRVLIAVNSVRRLFQEKHVKVLRLKQEYCTRGTVPNSVNKYLEELSNAVRHTGDYINRLSQAIKTDEIKQMQANMQRMQAGQRASFMQQVQEALRRGQLNPQAAVFLRGRFPTVVNPAFPNQRFNIRMPPPPFTYSTNAQASQNLQQPKITEVDDNVPTSTTNCNDKSSVTIEEIT